MIDPFCTICVTFCVTSWACLPPAPTLATCYALATSMDGISESVTGSSSLAYSCTNVAATCPIVGGAGVQVCASNRGFGGTNDVCSSFPGNLPNVISDIGYGAYMSGLGLNVDSNCGCSFSQFLS